MYASNAGELLWIFLTAIALGVGWSIGCWVVRKALS